MRYELYIAAMGDEAALYAFGLAARLRKLGALVETDHVGRSLKAQFKYADKVGAANVLTIGENELSAGKGVIKDMAGGTERETSLEAEGIFSVLRGV